MTDAYRFGEGLDSSALYGTLRVEAGLGFWEGGD